MSMLNKAFIIIPMNKLINATPKLIELILINLLLNGNDFATET